MIIDLNTQPIFVQNYEHAIRRTLETTGKMPKTIALISSEMQRGSAFSQGFPILLMLPINYAELIASIAALTGIFKAQ